MTMKAIGIVRKIDDLGRVVIPKELRDTLALPIGSSMEFFTTEDSIVIKRYSMGCTECGDSLAKLVGKSKICRPCARKLADH